MAGIFTRKALTAILTGEGREEEINTIMALYGKAIEDGYVSKTIAEEDRAAAITAALEDAKKNAPAPDIKNSDEYKALQTEYNAYKVKQEARTSADYADVKPKFFDAVYDKIDRGENAKPIAEQMQDMRENFAEFFTTQEQPDDKKPGKPQFGENTGGGQPSGEKGVSLADAWGYSKRFYGEKGN